MGNKAILAYNYINRITYVWWDCLGMRLFMGKSQSEYYKLLKYMENK